jgi:hypothetical protein
MQDENCLKKCGINVCSSRIKGKVKFHCTKFSWPPTPNEVDEKTEDALRNNFKVSEVKVSICIQHILKHSYKT